jgi:hypothetical protein
MIAPVNRSPFLKPSWSAKTEELAKASNRGSAKCRLRKGFLLRYTNDIADNFGSEYHDCLIFLRSGRADIDKSRDYFTISQPDFRNGKTFVGLRGIGPKITKSEAWKF